MEEETNNESIDEEPWPTPSYMKTFTSWETELTENEIQSNTKLYYAERDIKFLKKTIEKHYKNLSDYIEGIRSSRTLSQKKINAFTMECQIVNNFFQFSFEILRRLDHFFFSSNANEDEKLQFSGLYITYNMKLQEFQTKFENFTEAAVRYVTIPLYAESIPVRLQVRRMPAFKTAFQEVSTAFLSVLTPLQCAFSLKMIPIREKRELFFIEQFNNVAESIGEISALAKEIKMIEERRIQLEKSSKDLDQLFSILGKIRA